jgi:hypothetical protein
MTIRTAIATVAFLALGMSAANAASTLNVKYYSVQEPVGYGNDFGPCCSSPPATLENITLGSALGPSGLPVTTTTGAGAVFDQNAAGEILWWTPSATTGVTFTGSGVVSLPFASNMFAPNSTGGNNDSFFETAIFSGTLMGSGNPVSLSLSADDDALVYLNGLYVGGLPGVHATSSTTLDLGNLSGSNSLEIFYADRAQVAAYLALDVSGASIMAAVPEPATWAMMILGFGGVGFMMRRVRRDQVPA